MATDHDSLATASGHHGALEAVADALALGPASFGRSLPLLLAVGVGTLSVAVVADVSPIPRSYAAMSTQAAIADLAAGLGLIAAGGLSRHHQQRGSVGLLTALIGVAWLATDWVGWADGPAITRSIAMVIAPFLLPLVIHLGVSFPTGSVTGRLARGSVAVAYGATSVVSVGWTLIRDPYRDRYCWSNCTDNTFLVRAEPELARSLTVLWLFFVLGAGVLLAAAGSWRLGRTSGTARRTLAPVIAPVAFVAATQAVHAWLLLVDPAEHPDRPVSKAVFFARAVALSALAAGVTWAVLRELRTRRAVARLADDLGAAPPPGSLRSALARSLGDDKLDVAYWLPGPQIYVDASGQQVDPRPGPTQAATQIVRSGQQVAIVIHDRSLEDTHDLEREIGAASRLAVDNERLQAQAMAQLAALRASRTRIVETSDSARRQLERNLHDGAQQRLLALSYELQLAEADARLADERLAATLATATEKAALALVDLRNLAHGIFPVILTEAGLGAALATFIDTAPLHTQLIDLPDKRLPHDIETAVYLTVTAAIERAIRRSATRIVATFIRVNHELAVELIDDGSQRHPDPLVHIRDRVAALGGHLDVDGSHVRAVIPCG